MSVQKGTLDITRVQKICTPRVQIWCWMLGVGQKHFQCLEFIISNACNACNGKSWVWIIKSLYCKFSILMSINIGYLL